MLFCSNADKEYLEMYQSRIFWHWWGYGKCSVTQGESEENTFSLHPVVPFITNRWLFHSVNGSKQGYIECQECVLKRSFNGKFKEQYFSFEKNHFKSEEGCLTYDEQTILYVKEDKQGFTLLNTQFIVIGQCFLMERAGPMYGLL